jgi:hypothetical protein
MPLIVIILRHIYALKQVAGNSMSPIKRQLSLSFLVLLFVLFQTTFSQASTALTGQYGCLLNKNFGGYNTNNNSSTGFTGSNHLMYFDFNAGTFALNVVGVTNWGLSGISTKAMALTSATVSVSVGPIPNTYAALVSIAANGTSNLITYVLMPTNSGNTLLLQETPTTSINTNGEPSTGVCNKI